MGAAIMTVFQPEELSAWSGGEWSGSPGPVHGVDHDTRRLRPGALYVALRGERHDGHRFVAEAFRRGAAAAMVEAAWRPDGEVGPLLRVADSLAALGDLARGHRRRLRGRVVAVTGSVGKTTVKELIASALESVGGVARTPGNWNNDIGLPLSLLEMDPDQVFGVFEIGMNRPGELERLCDILRPDWAVITRIGPVHIEFFPDERAIAEEKATVLRRLPPDGCAVLAADEPWFDLLRERAAGRVVTVAFGAPADYSAEYSPRRPTRLSVRDRDGREAVYRLPQRGAPMRANALRAIAVAREAGVEPERIAEALLRFRPPPMRWEECRLDGVRWINDAYNANPISFREALRTFAETPGIRRRWLVLGGMRELGERTEEEHAALGRLLAAGDWAGLVTVGELGARFAEAVAAAGWPTHRLARCADAGTAAAFLRTRLRSGDAVLLKGSRSERVEEVLEEWRRRRTRPAKDAAANNRPRTR